MTDLRELRRLEPWFFRSPSAHNTQPWVLEYERDRIALGFDASRHLRVGDPTGRDLWLSLGCFAECVLIAAAAEGAPLEFDPERREFRAAETYETPFDLDDVDGRRTSRLPYGGPVGDIAALQSQLGRGETLHQLSNRDVLPLFVEADRRLYDSPGVVAELRGWLRLGPGEHRDGLSYDCLGLSRLEAAAFALLLHPLVYPAVRALRIHRRFTASSRRVLEDEGNVLVLEAPDGGESDLLESGRTLLRIWLALSVQGSAAHPLSQILDFEQTERALRELVGAGPEQRLVSIFRAGPSETPPRSGRLRS